MNKPFKLSVKAIILDKQQRCLLIRRSPANHSFVGKWEWPGGKVDDGEDFADAVVRETHEETSLKIKIIGLVGATQFEMPKLNVVLLCMEARLKSGKVQLSDEHDDFAWVTLGELMHWNDLLEAIRPVLNGFLERRIL